METLLRPAFQKDLYQILPWIENSKMLKYWGGHRLTYPPDPEKTWMEIGGKTCDTYVLDDTAGAIVGFGQTICREPSAVHLARIIVSPNRRGQGLGRIFCQQLIHVSFQHYRPAYFTLNVYRDNIPAVRLYKSLGFRVASEDVLQNSIGMELRLDSSKFNILET